MNLFHINRKNSSSNWIIYISFFISFILQIIPVPSINYRPSWISLFLIYWVMTFPCRVNIGTSFFLGLIMDIVSGATFGVHALAFTILSYLVIFKCQFILNMQYWQQSFIIILLSLINQEIICLVKFFFGNIVSLFDKKIFYKSLIDGILWPWLCLLMYKIRYHFNFHNN